MQITVHLHTILQRRTPAGTINRIEIDIPEGTTLEDLIEILEIELSLDNMLLAVNHRTADVDHILKEGDVVNLMPAISGGCNNEIFPDD